MSFLEAIIEGIIQGATEFLPVSSSGHLSLSKHFFGITVDSLLFDVLLHVGTLVAVLAVYYDVVWRLIRAFFRFCRQLFTGKFSFRTMDDDIRLLLMLFFGLIPLFLLFLPVPGTGRKIKDFADIWATDQDIILEGCALIVTSILLTLGVLSQRRYSGAHTKAAGKESGSGAGRTFLRLKDALTVGLVQCAAAVFPGVSRSGSTLSTGMMLGVNRKTALDYSFVLGIPSIMAAAVLTLKDASEAGEVIDWGPMLAGMITACIVGFLAIKLLRFMVTTNKLHVFAWYTLILGVICVIIGIIEKATGASLFSGAAIV
ncbi:MAG: undecaprenyl-diphosphate phosphatase [Clostridia bacterium]|nr:undecaprenyl-diphosphate phosphatase [Clostridia bacterium]